MFIYSVQLYEKIVIKYKTKEYYSKKKSFLQYDILNNLIWGGKWKGLSHSVA